MKESVKKKHDFKGGGSLLKSCFLIYYFSEGYFAAVFFRRFAPAVYSGGRSFPARCSRPRKEATAARMRS